MRCYEKVNWCWQGVSDSFSEKVAIDLRTKRCTGLNRAKGQGKSISGGVNSMCKDPVGGKNMLSSLGSL